MDCTRCGFDPCECVKPTVPTVRDTTRKPVENAITKEQFGLDLYDAIACCSGVQQLLRMIAAGVSHGKDVAHLSERYNFEKTKAKGLVQAETISIGDAARLTRQYPWLLT